MKYRIVEISKPQTFNFTVSKDWGDCSKWYVIEYQDDTTSHWFSSGWKRLKYNMEKVLRYGTGYGSYTPKLCEYDGIWEVGVYIPTMKIAKRLLDDFIAQQNAKAEQNKPDKVVLYSESGFNYAESSANSECTALLHEFNYFLDSCENKNKSTKKR